MVGYPYDCLANPIGAVRLSFEKALASASDPAAFDGKDWGAADLFQKFLFEDDGLCQVPMVTPSTIRSLQPNTLVRFRGMIQDMLGNEFYVGAYKDGDTWRTNKFADVSQSSMDSSAERRVWERRLLYCVPVPGQNKWAESSWVTLGNPLANFESSTRQKRDRDDDVCMDDAETHVSEHECEGSPSGKKLREDGISEPSSSSLGNKAGGNCSNDYLSPAANLDSFACLMKIYDSPESDLKLNEVFEFVGVLTFDAEFTVDKDEIDELDTALCENAITHQVPRIHCLNFRKIAAHDFVSVSPTLEPKPSIVQGIRESLLGHLTTVLGNDGLAAQFMLLHLLSSVHARVDSVAVGKLSLNLTCLSKDSISVLGNRLNLAIQDLMPFTHSLPFSVYYLNSASLAPRKDYQTNRLLSGALQLAEGSHLTIDETQLQTGTLNETGVDNTRVLKILMERQKVEYDFTFYKMEMDADVQILVLSEAKSNILPADVVVPFHPSSADTLSGVEQDVLKAWRWYLATLRSLPHSIEEEMQKVVENDLVAARQADRSLGSEELSRLVTLGRLVSVSLGETRLSLEHWQMAKELERLRKERVQERRL